MRIKFETKDFDDQAGKGILVFTTLQKTAVEFYFDKNEIWFVCVESDSTDIEIEPYDQAMAGLFFQRPNGDFIGLNDLTKEAISQFDEHMSDYIVALANELAMVRELRSLELTDRI